eukprot:TRINITY_DN66718_c2_g5_i1.p1 TRINITY_DN66718_c2_g5~~TRINITY_DN66718_c2_g5_i1.p1  ORF type:complete len:375 (-),score=20.40 TRINITY_DN66718_c2_g5_i1:131-1168(-)
MRELMKNAKVGDDVMEEDPTVKELEQETAKLLGKEAGLFVPTGTMGNLICQLVHCQHRCSEVLLGDKSHVFLNEVGGTACVGSIHSRQVPNNEDGTLDLDLVRSLVRTGDIHQPWSKLLILENTHNFCGGRVLPIDYLKKARELADQEKLKLHCDGARLWNAAAALGVDISELAAPFDSLSLCLSKGLGCPVGSVIVGQADFIKQARRVRKMLGGGMRQVGVLAAAGLMGIRENRLRIGEDHKRLKQFADGLQPLGIKIAGKIETNIMFIDIVDALPGVDNATFSKKCKEHGLLISPFPLCKTQLRVVTHLDNTDSGIEEAIAVVKKVIAELGGGAEPPAKKQKK